MMLTILSSLIQFNNHLMPVVQDPLLPSVAVDRELILGEDAMTPTLDIASHLNKKSISESLALRQQSIQVDSAPIKEIEEVKNNNNTAQDGIIAQWFFDTKVDGYSDNRGQGHCTQYAARYRWKHHDTKITWRGNANQRRQNALDDNRPTGDTPKLGSLIVTDAQVGVWSEYGHVGVIVQINEQSGKFLVEDMNYQGEYMVTHRWMSPDEPYILGYIYLPE